PGVVAPILFHKPLGRLRRRFYSGIPKSRQNIAFELFDWIQRAGVKTYSWRITLDSISAGALCKRGEWNAFFRFASLSAKRQGRCGRTRLQLFRGLSCSAQLFPES